MNLSEHHRDILHELTADNHTPDPVKWVCAHHGAGCDGEDDLGMCMYCCETLCAQHAPQVERGHRYGMCPDCFATTFAEFVALSGSNAIRAELDKLAPVPAADVARAIVSMATGRAA